MTTPAERRDAAIRAFKEREAEADRIRAAQRAEKERKEHERAAKIVECRARWEHKIAQDILNMVEEFSHDVEARESPILFHPTYPPSRRSADAPDASVDFALNLKSGDVAIASLEVMFFGRSRGDIRLDRDNVIVAKVVFNLGSNLLDERKGTGHPYSSPDFEERVLFDDFTLAWAEEFVERVWLKAIKGQPDMPR